MLPAGWLVHTASVERYTGSDVDGAAYAAAVDVACYSETKAALVEKPDGVEIGVDGTLWANEASWPVGSRVTLTGGRIGYVLSALPYDDGGGLAHTEIVLSSVPNAGETRTATVTLSKPPTGDAEWDEDAEATVPAAGAVYASNVSARIASQVTRSVSDSVDSAEEAITVPPYMVSVDHDLNAYEGDRVLVTACAADASLVGRTLQVEQVIRGTNRLERDLYCTLFDVVRPA